MKKWMNMLFYMISFFAMTVIIYQLAFFIPPERGSAGYKKYCLSVGGIAVLLSGAMIGSAAALDWCIKKEDEIESEEKKKSEE